MSAPQIPSKPELVIVDDVPMVDVPLARRLFQGIDLNRTVLMLVGDHNQLPPVVQGNVLRGPDPVACGLPTVIIPKVMRQAGDAKTSALPSWMVR